MRMCVVLFFLHWVFCEDPPPTTKFWRGIFGIAVVVVVAPKFLLPVTVCDVELDKRTIIYNILVGFLTQIIFLSSKIRQDGEDREEGGEAGGQRKEGGPVRPSG